MNLKKTAALLRCNDDDDDDDYGNNDNVDGSDDNGDSSVDNVNDNNDNDDDTDNNDNDNEDIDKDSNNNQPRFQGFSPPRRRRGAENPGIGCSRDFQTPRKVKFNKIALLNIRGEEFRRQFKCLSAVRAFSPHIPVMVIRATTLAPIKKAKRNLLHPIFLGGETHVISRHQDLAYLY